MIRRANENDLDMIIDIWLMSNIKEHSFISEDYWRNHFDEVRIAISNAEVYVFEDYVIKAFVGLAENYIAGIFVKEEFRSKGIGGKLIRFLQKTKSELSLHVYEKNKNAVRFYTKHGFQVSKKRLEIDTKQTEYLMVWKEEKL